jgi:hypothetical protein
MSKYIFLYVAPTDSEYALRCLGFHEGTSRSSALAELLNKLEKQRYHERIEQWNTAEQRIAYQVDGEWEIDEYGHEVAQQQT